MRIAALCAIALLLLSYRIADAGGAGFDTGSPATREIWVDPAGGNDANSGASRREALLTVREAWGRVPEDPKAGRTGWCILLMPGDYPESSLPDNGWMASRRGTRECPVIVRAADPQRRPRLHGYLNISGCAYLYLMSLEIVTDRGYGGGGNAVHIEKSDHVLIRECALAGFDGDRNQPQETLKVNQSTWLFVERCDISGAAWFAVDLMAVHYGHITGSRLHDSDDDCVVLKGGTAHFRIEGNEIFNSRNVGFAAGQGSGFEYMVAPWLHYEAYDLKFVSNVVRDVRNAGAAVRGGCNILVAHNTFCRVGVSEEPGASLVLIAPGSRGCDGDVVEAKIRHDLGGWGPLGEARECIPNRNVYIFNNLFTNPAPARTRWSHLDVFGPADAPADSNIPSPVRSDDNLLIKGNIIWNGPPDHPLGIEDESRGCRPSNGQCNERTLREENVINVEPPELTADLRPVQGGNVFKAPTFPIPDFPDGDVQPSPRVPRGDLSNAVPFDFDGTARAGPSPPGAFTR